MADEQEIQDLLEQLKIHRDTLKDVRNQFYQLTSAYALPQHFQTIRASKRAIQEIKHRLRTLGYPVDDPLTDDTPSEEELSGTTATPPGKSGASTQHKHDPEGESTEDQGPDVGLPSFFGKYWIVIILIIGIVVAGLYWLLPEKTQPEPEASCPIPTAIPQNALPVLVTKLTYSSDIGDKGYESTIFNELKSFEPELKGYNLAIYPIMCDKTFQSSDEAEVFIKKNPAYAQSIILWGNVNALGGAVYVQRFGANKIDIAASTAPTSTTTLGFTSLLEDEYLRFFAYYAVSQSFFLVENYTATLPLINQALIHIEQNPSIRLQGLGQAYFQLGWSQLAIVDSDTALATLEEGLAFLHKSGMIDYEAQYLLSYHSSYIHSYYGDNAPYLDKDRDDEYQKAFDVLDPFLSIPRYSIDPALYNQLGYIKYQQRAYDEALHYLLIGRQYEIANEMLNLLLTRTNTRERLDGALLKNIGLVYYEREKESGQFTRSRPLLLIARERYLDAGPRMQANITLFSITETTGKGDCDYLRAAAADKQPHTFRLNDTVDKNMDDYCS